MTIRPSPPMRDFEVSAILREVAEPGSGKSMFRLVLKPQPYVARHCTVCGLGMGEWSACDAPDCGDLGPGVPIVKTFPFAIGDVLWCRETWRCNGWASDLATIMYRASKGDGYTAMTEQFPVDGKVPIAVSGHWLSSTQMPRWASRLTLEVVGVRIERLQAIGEEDAIAEGIERDRAVGMPSIWGWRDYLRGDEIAKRYYADPRESFRTLWSSIHGPGSWSANPFVAAVTFRPHLANVDDLLRQREGGR